MSVVDTFHVAILALAKWRRGEPEPIIIADNNAILISDVFRLYLDIDDVMPPHIAAMVSELQRYFWKAEECLQWGASYGDAGRAMLRLAVWKDGTAEGKERQLQEPVLMESAYSDASHGTER